MKALQGEKPARPIGDFILHENFTDAFLEDEATREMYKNLGPLERVFV